MMVVLLLCLLLTLVLIVALPPFRPAARQLWVLAALLALASSLLARALSRAKP